MKSGIRAMTLSTIVSWCTAVALTRMEGPIAPEALAFSLLALCVLLVWIQGRRGPGLEEASPPGYWAAYVALVTAACSWYIHARGAILLVELLLPTTAVLVVLVPIRTLWLERNWRRRRARRDDSLVGTNARDDAQG